MLDLVKSYKENYSCMLSLSHTGLGTGAPIIESPYGDNVQPEEAPESISRAVASLPPEQMFELMKQMKVWWRSALQSDFQMFGPVLLLAQNRVIK